MDNLLFRIISFSAMGLILALFLTINIACGILADTITFWVVGYTVEGGADADATREAGEKLAEQIMEEGAVLVQNNDNVLPLSKTDSAKVNVFGWSATQWIAGGSGSGRVVSDGGYAGYSDTGLLEALDGYGIEYNSELINYYKSYQNTRPYVYGHQNDEGTLHTYNYQYSRLFEPNIVTGYSDSIRLNAELYSDTAIVVIGRTTGESNDAPMAQYKGTYGNKNTGSIPSDSTKTYLEISTEEEELLEYVGANFENVVVLINSTNTMELGFMETIAGLDSCMVVGGTGVNAATAIPKLLYGDATPSGRLSSIYAYELETASTFANSGANLRLYEDTSAKGYYPYDGTNNGNVDGNEAYPGIAYVDYAEGIYLGYRWYETADAEGYWDTVSNEYGKGYNGVVQYPFGYGLSYTTFEKSIGEVNHSSGSTVTADDTIEITVDVTNTGNVAGREVVQVYFTAPYTSGGIEKASIELIATAKTVLPLKPGETESLALSFKVSDMASYDDYDKNKNGFKGYELEAGSYTISIMDNSHTPSVMASGSPSTITYNIADTKITTDAVSGGEIKNRFTGDDATDGLSIDGSDSGQDITFLSRADFKGTFPTVEATGREFTKELQDSNLYTSADATAWASQEASTVTFGVDSGLRLYDANGITETGLALGANYNHRDWDLVLNQITKSEMEQVILQGFLQTAAISSVGKPTMMDVDGPAQAGSFNKSEYGTGFPMSTVLAQTFNPELSYSYGLALGQEAGVLGFDGLYAPGLNLHRSPFGGRNYEYYSEDSYLTGVMCAMTVKGCLNTGVYTYLKHLALYETESYRDGLYTWCTEQALRELYLEPFRESIQVGGSSGIMTAYNRIGAFWTGGSEALITGVMREEYGFEGTILTDYADHHAFMNMDHALQAGGDLWMGGYLNNSSFLYSSSYTNSNTYDQALRQATKNILYTGANALYANSVYNADDDNIAINKGLKVYGFVWWIPLLIVIDILVAGGLGVWTFFVLKRKDGLQVSEVPSETATE